MTDVWLRRQLSQFLSSHGLNTRMRTFRVRGGFRQHLYCSEYTEGFTRPKFSRTRTSKKYTEHQIQSSHGSCARRNETRTSNCSSTRRDQARTSQCAREETKQLRTPPSARTKQKDQFARFECADTNLFLSEFTKRGRCDNQQSGTQHQQRIQHDTTRDVTPDEDR